ncbi:MAG: A24 family peptidase [Candidatus Anstonellaceae archaeon]
METFILFEQKMEFELLRILIAVLGTTIAAYYDIFNKKNIPEKFLYAFLIISFLVNLLDIQNLIPAVFYALIVFLIFYILYRAGEVGGADGYILSSITLALPYQPKIFLIFEGFFPLPFIINVFVFAAISFVVYVFLKTIKIVLKNFKIEKKNAIQSLIIIFSYLILIYTIKENPIVLGLVSPQYILLLSVMVFLMTYYTLFKDIINNSMIEFVSVKEVEPEDMIAIEKMDINIVKKFDLKKLVTKEQYEKMKSIRGKKIALYKHLPPFVPHILIGLIFGLFFGDLLTLLNNVFI